MQEASPGSAYSLASKAPAHVCLLVLLAEMTFGYSRDDISKFLPIYLEKGILQYDPFQVRGCMRMLVCNLPSCACFFYIYFDTACVG